MKIIATALLITATFAANAQETKIKPTDLPNESMEFIHTHFPKTTVKTAVRDTDKETKTVTYEVVLADATEIEFKDNGSWKEIDGKSTAIPVALIPKPFWEYVKKNYPKEEVLKIEKGAQEIELKLTNGVEVVFDIHGRFLRIDK